MRVGGLGSRLRGQSVSPPHGNHPSVLAAKPRRGVRVIYPASMALRAPEDAPETEELPGSLREGRPQPKDAKGSHVERHDRGTAIRFPRSRRHSPTPFRPRACRSARSTRPIPVPTMATCSIRCSDQRTFASGRACGESVESGSAPRRRTRPATARTTACSPGCLPRAGAELRGPVLRRPAASPAACHWRARQVVLTGWRFR